MQVYALVRLGDTERAAQQTLAGFGERDRDRAEMHTATAVLRLAQHDPDAAAPRIVDAIHAGSSLAAPALGADLSDQAEAS